MEGEDIKGVKPTKLNKMKKKDILKKFGFDPETIGLRHRGWWVLTKENIDEEDKEVAKIGDLVVKTRDNGIDDIDIEAIKKPNFIGKKTDWFDSTYLYYYFRKLTNPTK